MQTLLIRLSDQDRALLDRLAAQGHGSRASILREALMTLSGAVSIRDPERNRLLAGLAADYAKVGMLLNQIARRLNTDGGLDAGALGKVLLRLIALTDVTRRELAATAAGAGAKGPQRATSFPEDAGAQR
jgi:predicted transcriptional regulator